MNTVWDHLHAESQKAKLTETKSRIRFPGAGGGDHWGDVGRRVQTWSWKMNTFWRSDTERGDYMPQYSIICF